MPKVADRWWKPGRPENAEHIRLIEADGRWGVQHEWQFATEAEARAWIAELTGGTWPGTTPCVVS